MSLDHNLFSKDTALSERSKWKLYRSKFKFDWNKILYVIYSDKVKDITQFWYIDKVTDKKKSSDQAHAMCTLKYSSCAEVTTLLWRSDPPKKRFHLRFFFQHWLIEIFQNYYILYFLKHVLMTLTLFQVTVVSRMSNRNRFSWYSVIVVWLSFARQIF